MEFLKMITPMPNYEIFYNDLLFSALYIISFESEIDTSLFLILFAKEYGKYSYGLTEIGGS